METFYTNPPSRRVPVMRADGTEGGWYYVDEYGVENGPYHSLYPDGSPKIDGHYRNGMRHGMWKVYSQDRTVMAETQYHDNKIVAQWKVGK